MDSAQGLLHASLYFTTSFVISERVMEDFRVQIPLILGIVAPHFQTSFISSLRLCHVLIALSVYVFN